MLGDAWTYLLKLLILPPPFQVTEENSPFRVIYLNKSRITVLGY